MNVAVKSNDQRAASRRAQRRFALVFIGTSAILFAAYSFPYKEVGWSEGWFQGYLSGYARMAGSALRLCEPHVRVDGNLITGRFSLRIVKTCDAMEANVLFAAAVLAFPGPWKRKIVALGVGLAGLVALNVVRICSLYYVGALAPSAFELLHIEVWPLVLVVLASVEFLAFATWIGRAEGRGTAKGPY